MNNIISKVLLMFAMNAQPALATVNICDEITATLQEAVIEQLITQEQADLVSSRCDAPAWS